MKQKPDTIKSYTDLKDTILFFHCEKYTCETCPFTDNENICDILYNHTYNDE